jgi:Alcohol dehydrogenase GroES-like domain
VPHETEVLVRVHAASINDWDWGLLNGPTLPFTFGPPRQRILGSDVAGRVAAVGSGVQRFRVGDEVYGDLSIFGARGWGGFAEYVCAPERALVPKPARMTFEQAAALPQAGQLAVQGLFANGPLRAGQRILINGAGGGVGTIAIQLAKLQDVRRKTGDDAEARLRPRHRLHEGRLHQERTALRPDSRYEDHAHGIRVRALALSARHVRDRRRTENRPTAAGGHRWRVDPGDHRQGRATHWSQAEPGPGVLERALRSRSWCRSSTAPIDSARRARPFGISAPGFTRAKSSVPSTDALATERGSSRAPSPASSDRPTS